MSKSNQSLLNQLLSRDLTYTYHCSPFIKRLFEADKALEQFSLQHISHPFSRQEMESWLDSRRISDEISLNKSLRILRQQVIANIILRDLNKLADLDEVLKSVTALAEITLIHAHQFHFNALKSIHGAPIGLTGEEQLLSIVGMGKLGGEELNVSSDIDLIFAYPEEGDTESKESISNQSFFIKLCKKIISSLNDVTEDGFVFRVDMQLRPFGSEGQIVCSYQMLEDYYQKYGREWERYSFLKWGQQAFDNFKVVPPGTGICHQVNLEYLSKVVWSSEMNGELTAYPDTLVGTDSHTTMVNGLSVLGWGVGGIEAEAVMLGQPISMLIPEVVGFEVKGKLPEGTTATDLVLTVTQMLRKKGVVGKFVEFYGDGLKNLSLADRATIANMAPEYGATCGFFPIDEETLKYLEFTGRDKDLIVPAK